MSLAAFFAGSREARAIFDRVQATIDQIGPAAVNVSKSQVSFRRKRVFASAWMPGQYLHRARAPLVLTLYFRHREPSSRWKAVVEAKPGHFTHHLELRAADEVDDEVHDLVRKAWEAAT